MRTGNKGIWTKASDNETKLHDSGANCNLRTTLIIEQHVSAELGNLFQLRENKSPGDKIIFQVFLKIPFLLSKQIISKLKILSKNKFRNSF